MGDVRVRILLAFCVVMSVAPVGFAQDGADKAPEAAKGQALTKEEQMWADYIHYTRIAQMELALTAGNAFLKAELTPEARLKIVDEGPYPDWDQTLIRAQRMVTAPAKAGDKPVPSEPAKVAEAVIVQIQSARMALAREDARIRDAIVSLAKGQRAQLNATNRLRAAGQYAAPQLLAVLMSREPLDQELRPYAIEAMVAVGKPLVGPLCEAIRHLPPVPQEQVAQVLARIGYPVALPYLKDILEQKNISDRTREVAQVAFNAIYEHSKHAPAGSTADQLYLQLAEDYYARRGSLIQEPTAPHNLLWVFDSGVLSYKRVPTAVYGDAMAMRVSKRALQLNPQMSSAVSLWLAANFRRENNLPQGEMDPSYDKSLQSAAYYATVYGPRHVHPVLQRAMGDGDSELALDAIKALYNTAGEASLINTGGSIQPLIAAMSYPDRRVRYEAALAIARANPSNAFPGSGQVVPVLADAVRRVDKPVVLLLAADRQKLNVLGSLVAGLKARVIQADTVETAAAQVAMVPGVDLVVVEGKETAILSAVSGSRNHYKLKASPILALSQTNDRIALTRRFVDDKLVVVTDRAADEASLGAAVAQAAGLAAGRKLDDKQAENYAVQALAQLQQITIDSTRNVFSVGDAKPALLEALGDTRVPVVLGAAKVLERVGSSDSQQALGTAAIDTKLGAAVQVALLKNLAAHARYFKPQLSQAQVGLLLKLVGESSGEIADAAAEAYGSMNLPSELGTKLITSAP